MPMNDVYTAISIAPVQGFIEKTRKLRDLYGASRILSHLSSKFIDEAQKTTEIISPGLITVNEDPVKEGMPNRILLKGAFSQQEAEEIIVAAWRNILEECRIWIEQEFKKYYPDWKFNWELRWQYWRRNTWEVFWGQGDSITAAMEDLETRKLSRNWTALNWVGESSTLTGTDSIAHPSMGDSLDLRVQISKIQKDNIKEFYRILSCLLEYKNPKDREEPEGKFLDLYERLSVPELAKRLVTKKEIGRRLEAIHLKDNFTDIDRYDADKKQGQWTGWFMGDGDKVGNKLKALALQGEESVKTFTTSMREWGQDFQESFDSNFGRVIYAGGDDFLGIIYSQNIKQPISPIQALDWLRQFPEKWQEHGQDITVSVSFVWAAPRVPQRDILQHCREAEQKAKTLGRDRVTIRVVFNNGQYLDWTCRWQDLAILTYYEDRDGIGYQGNNFFSYKNRDREILDKPPNWSHVYEDLAYLKARHAIEIIRDGKSQYPANKAIALYILNLYFPLPEKTDYLSKDWGAIVGNSNYQDRDILVWINGLINIGWQLCSQEIKVELQNV
jgi:CRISPR-associated protein Cmr2